VRTALIDENWYGTCGEKCDRIVLRQQIFGLPGDLVANFAASAAPLAKRGSESSSGKLIAAGFEGLIEVDASVRAEDDRCRRHLRNMLADGNINACAHPNWTVAALVRDRADQLRGRHAQSRRCIETPCSAGDLDEIAIVAVCPRRLPGQNSLRPT
jgi:hypothetical protein